MKQRGRRVKGRGSKSSLPRARQDVLTMDVADEIVVYDQKQHRAHSLNPPAATIWRCLDGRTSMKELVARLRKELDVSADEDMVWLALKELDRADLLEGQLEVPASRDVSRREALRRFGVAAAGGAVLLPAVSSLVAPPVHAQISAVGCGTPEPNCGTFSCANNCACAPTTEGTNVCVQAGCSFRGCNSSAGCLPGEVCTTIDCCGQPLPFCVSIAPAGSVCSLPNTQGPSAWR